MKIIISLLFSLLLTKSSLSQSNKKLIGTWKLSHSLQVDKKMCDLPKDSTKLIFDTAGTYYWNDHGAITKGKWKVLNHKLRFYDIQVVNFKGKLSDVSYSFELSNNSLIIHRPEGVEIPCPHEYYFKVK